MRNNIDIYGAYYKPYCGGGCYDNYNCQTGSKNFYVSCNDSNVKVDCVVDNKKGLKVYGKAVYKNQRPCVNAVVMLYKYENNCRDNMVFVKKTYTNCDGRYELDLAYKQTGKYVVKVEICNDYAFNNNSYNNYDSCNCEPSYCYDNYCNDDCNCGNAYYNYNYYDQMYCSNRNCNNNCLYY